MSPPAASRRAEASAPSFATSFFRFFRFEYLSFAMILPLIGIAAASPDAPVPLWRLVGILAAALAMHVHINLMNDVCDLPFDRHHPGRQKYPLVRGVIKRGQVAAIATAAVPIALAIIFALDGDGAAYVAMFSMIAAIAIYNVWGKRFVVPIITDIALGIGYASITLFGALMIAPATRLTWLAVAWVVVWTLQINLLGGIRDLNFDRAAGARTTPLVFGMVPRGAGLTVPRALVTYAFMIEAGLFALSLSILALNDFHYAAYTRVLVGLGVTLLAISNVFVWRFLLGLMARDYKAMTRVAFVAIGVTFLSIVVLFAANPNRWPLTLVVLTYFIPLRKLLYRSRKSRT
jgi:4-hydroxybenzoate polyprenyltransferase